MKDRTIIYIQATGNSGDSSSRAKVALPKQRWVRRSASRGQAAMAAATQFWGVSNDRVNLVPPTSEESALYTATLLAEPQTGGAS